jgi:hypothetical protein
MLIRKKSGKFVVVEDRKILGRFDTYDEAFAFMHPVEKEFVPEIPSEVPEHLEGINYESTKD